MKIAIRRKAEGKIAFLVFVGFVTVCSGVLGRQTARQCVTEGALAYLLGVFWYYFFLMKQEETPSNTTENRNLIFLCAVSLLLLGLSVRLPVEGLALFSVLWMARKRNLYSALFLHAFWCAYYGVFHLCIPFDERKLLSFAILGGVVALLYAQKLEQGIQGYMCCILCSSYGILFLVSSGLSIRKELARGTEFLAGLAQVILLWLWGMYCIKKDDRKADIKDDRKNLEMDQKELPAMQPILEKVIDPNYELLKQLNQFSVKLYEHSMLVGKMAGEAADIVGGNRLLAQAGGYYHEIGRMKDQEQYLENGILLARQYQFPEELIDVIRQHNMGSEMPKSKEAAVVMLSDCLVSTSEYLQEQGKREQVTDEALVSGIFLNRLQKGNLSQSGLTEEEIERLKEYYINFENQQHIA